MLRDSERARLQEGKKKAARVFVGLEPPKALVRELSRLRDRYGKIPYLRWLLPGDWHLTVLFVGAVARECLSEYARALEEVAFRHEAPTLTLEKVTYAPPHRPASMVWARFAPHEQLDRLAREVLNITRGMGIEAAQRNPGVVTIPHITLARFQEKAKVPPGQLRTIRAEPLRGAEVPFSRLVLYETVGRGDRGQRYKQLARFRLEGLEGEEGVSTAPAFVQEPR